MQVGDTIEILLLADKVKGRIVQVEKYRRGYIVSWDSLTKQRSTLVVFPDLPYLPQALLDEEVRPDLYSATAWLYWKNHIWPVPVGNPGLRMSKEGFVTGSRLIRGDPREHARAKIDHILALEKNMHADMEIYPQDDWELEQHRKWWR